MNEIGDEGKTSSSEGHCLVLYFYQTYNTINVLICKVVHIEKNTKEKETFFVHSDLDLFLMKYN
jgi:hypothetical protein